MLEKHKKERDTISSLSTPKMPGKPEVSALIGNRLNKYYNDFAQHALPDQMLDLLHQLALAEDEHRHN